MEIVYDASVLTTEIKYQYIDGKPTIPTLPHQITLTEAREGVGTDPILFTPTSAKDMIEIHVSISVNEPLIVIKATS
jgi:hypothetical protein